MKIKMYARVRKQDGHVWETSYYKSALGFCQGFENDDVIIELSASFEPSEN